MNDREIPNEFVTYAANILGETSSGFSGPQIVKITTSYAVKYNISIPHSAYPFGMRNKKTALAENLIKFDGAQLFEIIDTMCKELDSDESQELLLLLIKRYGHLNRNPNPDGVNEELIQQTRHWLSKFPEVLDVFNSAIEKQSHGLYKRNLLDDLRLSLELLLKNIFENSKSLENQLPILGGFIKDKGGSTELSNMFHKLIDYYTKYQNTYVKHGDAVNEEEIEFICEITASFMKHFIRLNDK
ncbi:hypothetical protein [Alkalispirochaeta alkalica]|uniref:hypothetical protein n=1 Tax=Alkalispirochaeta alkalica TaxID=46356 RepID=UPI000A073E10|nr:hypothetical protein [Alkalispirochaeta alkalica]